MWFDTWFPDQPDKLLPKSFGWTRMEAKLILQIIYLRLLRLRKFWFFLTLLGLISTLLPSQ